MHGDTMQTERAGMNEAGNRKAKRWGFRWHPDRLTQSSWPIELAALAGCPGRPDRASRSQYEPTSRARLRWRIAQVTHSRREWVAKWCKSIPVTVAQSSWQIE